MRNSSLLRVLHVTRDLPPVSKGGLSTAVGGLITAQVRAGHACGALSFDGWRPARGGQGSQLAERGHHNGASVCRLSAPAQLEDARRFAQDCMPDLLHVHHGMLWPFAEELRRSLGVPAAFTVHVHQAEMNRLRGVTEQTKSLEGQVRALSGADLVLAPSVACARAVRADYPGLEVVVTPLGVEPGDEPLDAERRGPLLYVGRLGDVKGTLEFFALCQRILPMHPDLGAVVVGGLPDSPRGERRWRRRWEEGAPSEIASRLHFAGWCGPEVVREYLRTTRALVVPSWTETFGLTVLEGMLAAAPVVASACPAIAELLDEGVGVLVPPRDVDALTVAVDAVLSDPVSARAMGGRAALRARERHRWDRVVGTTLEAYRSVLGRPREG